MEEEKNVKGRDRCGKYRGRKDLVGKINYDAQDPKNKALVGKSLEVKTQGKVPVISGT